MVTGSPTSHPLSRDEILAVLVTYAGTTTSNGAATFDSLIDSRLIGTDPQAITDKLVQIGSGPDIAQQCTAIAFNPATGEVTFTPAASNQVMAGTTWRLVNIAGALSGGGTTPQNIVDAVYFDDILGVAGVTGTIGTPTNPVNNLPDALSLMATRKLNKMVLAGTGPHAIIFTGIVTDTQVIGNAEYDITVAGGFDATFDGDLLCQNLVNSGVGTVVIKGNLTATANVINSGGGNVVVLGDLRINADTSAAATGTLDNTGGNKITVAGDAIVNGAITVPVNTILIVLGSLRTKFNGSFFNAGLVIIDGSFKSAVSVIDNQGIMDINGDALFGSAAVNNTGSAQLKVAGDVQCVGPFIMGDNASAQIGSLSCQGGITQGSTAALLVNGNLQCAGDIDASATGDITVKGDCKVGDRIIHSGSGLININGRLDINGDPRNVGFGVLDNTGGGDVTIDGDCFITGGLINGAGSGNIVIMGNCRAAYMDNADSNSIEIFGNFTATEAPSGGVCGHIINSGGGNVVIHGDVSLNGNPGTPGGYIDNTGGQDIRIYGNLFMTGTITNPGVNSHFEVDGKTYVKLSITNNGIWDSGPVESGSDIVQSGVGSMFINGDCCCHGNINTVTQLLIKGNCHAVFGITCNNGTVIIMGNAIIGATGLSSLENSNGGSVTINGNCQVADHVKNLANCVMSIAGKLDINGDPISAEGYLDNTGATSLHVGGDCHINGPLTNTTGTVSIFGDFYDGGDLTNGAGAIYIVGESRIYGSITNAGTLVYHNITDVESKGTTIDLNQIAGTYDLFSGNIVRVMLESLVITMPNLVAGGALTGISIQTDDATPQVIISAVQGLVANLTAENQLFWTGRIRIASGKKIQLTIVGGATGVAYVCNVDAQYKGVTPAGYLAS